MDKQKIIELIDSNAEKAGDVISEKIKIWAEYELFSALWWMGVVLTLLPWVIWFLVRPKESTDRLLYVGLMVMVFSLTTDVLGDQFSLWHYRFNVIPTIPTYVPWDITLMPVTIMLILQTKPRTNIYLKALIFALISSYIAEPIFHWVGVYNPKNWRYTYSVPIQFLLYIAAYYILQRRSNFEQIPKAIQ